MAFGEHTIHNRLRIKRFSHRSRFNQAIRLLSPQPGDRILDYGSGDGVLLQLLNAAEPRAMLCGYEPVHAAAAIKNLESVSALVGIYSDLESVAAFKPGKLACLEVLEHLRLDDLRSVLSTFRRLLGDEGLAVISVPIEIGAASLLKNIIRKTVDQAHRGIDVRSVMLCALGMTSRIERDLEEPYIASHIGFDYRDLEALIQEQGFRVKRSYSPFPVLGPLMNTQVFFVLQAQNPILVPR